MRPGIPGKIYRSNGQDHCIRSDLLEKIYDMRYPQAKKELMKLCGVGEKVAEYLPVCTASYGCFSHRYPHPSGHGRALQKRISQPQIQRNAWDHAAVYFLL